MSLLSRSTTLAWEGSLESVVFSDSCTPLNSHVTFGVGIPLELQVILIVFPSATVISDSPIIAVTASATKIFQPKLIIRRDKK